MKRKVIKDLEESRIILFLDEAIFSPQTQLCKSWAGRYYNPEIQDKRIFLKTYALILAISQEFGITHFKILKDSAKSQDFLVFLTEIKKKLKDWKISIFMDNLSVRRSKIVKESLEQLNINPIYSAPYSPQYNGIESTFSTIKTLYKQELIKRLEQNKRIYHRQCIEISVNKVQKQTIINQINNGLDQILNV